MILSVFFGDLLGGLTKRHQVSWDRIWSATHDDIVEDDMGVSIAMWVPQ